MLWGLWQFYLVRAEYQTARELGEQLLSLAQRIHDPALLVGGPLCAGDILYHLGELAARPTRIWSRGWRSMIRQQHRHHGLPLWAGPWGVLPLLCRAWPLWLLGYPDQALPAEQ